MPTLAEIAAAQKAKAASGATTNVVQAGTQSATPARRRFGASAEAGPEAANANAGNAGEQASGTSPEEPAGGSQSTSLVPADNQPAVSDPKPKFGSGGGGSDSRSLVQRSERADTVPPKPSANAGSFDSLDDLANSTELDATDLSTVPNDYGVQLDGETEASAPTRELPEDMTDSMKMFVEQLDGIYGVLFDAELFGNMTKNIMIELQDNPEYIKLIADQDIHVMIRGMRDAMGLARIKKVEGKRKTASTGRAKVAKSTEVSAAVDSMFDDSDF